MSHRGFWLCLLALVSLRAVTGASARTMYVTDVFEVVVRSERRLSGGNIIKVLNSGDALEVRSVDTEWATVALGDGRTGYVKKHLLVSREPYKIIAERLQGEAEQQRQRLESMTQELTELRQAHKQLSDMSSTQGTQLETVSQQYEQLRQDSSQFLQLQEEYTALQQRYNALQQEIAVLNDSYTSVRKSRNVLWFLSGGGVILIGWLLGMVSERWRGRRRQGGGYSYHLPR